MTTPTKVTRRVPPTDDHEAQKWLILECSVEGCPEVTKRRSVNVAALVAGTRTLEDERAKLEADVDEYYARWLVVQEAIGKL